MLIVESLLLLLVAFVAVFAICSAHIPGVRELTGAAPLVGDEDERCAGCVGCGGPDCIEREAVEPTFVRDVAATQRARLGESVEEWATRTGQQPTRAPRPAPAVVHLPEPRKEGP